MDLTNCTPESSFGTYLSLFYTHITNHVITADGKFLLAAIKAGYLAAFPIRSYLKDLYLLSEISVTDTFAVNRAKKLKPTSLCPLDNSLSLCLDKQQESSPYKLVAGGQGTIKGYIWSQASQLEPKWTIKLPSDNTLANAIIVSNDKIFSGCSDNHVYVHDKETQKELITLSGHQDYIHSLKITEDHISLLYSASEDGSVRVWDIRTPKEPTTVILPFKKGSLERPELGKWIGAIDVSPNCEWLVCGGGPKLSVWHLRSNKFVHVIESPTVTYVAQFLPSDPSNIMFAGNGNLVSTWRMATNSTASGKIDSSIDNIYSIVHHDYVDYDYSLSSFSGDNFKLELCKNGKYIDSELYVS